MDPITFEVIKGAVQAAGREMGVLIERTAMSPFIREKKDYFAGLADRHARILFTMNDKTGPGMLEAIFERYPPEAMRPGDVFWINDCYLTGGAISHSSDMCFATPVFFEAQIVAFSLCFGHFWDIGGARPGSLSPYNVDIFQEGINVPAVRIVDQGTLNDDLYRTVLRNSRFPEILEGDSRAMMAATRLGHSRMLDLFQRFGLEMVERAFEEQHAQSERAVRRYLAEGIRPGRYTFADFVDNDCVSDTPFRVQVDAEFRGDEVAVVDGTRSDDQARGPINYLLHPEIARMIFSRFLLWKDESVMHNAGSCRPIKDVVLRPGSLLQPIRPAALGLRGHSMYRFLNSVLGLFAQATDGDTPAGSPDYIIVMLRSLDVRTGEYFLCTDGIGVGQGARPFADGLDVIYSSRGQKNYPMEFMDIEFPVRVERYEVHQNSGGPGRYRGGTGVVRDIRVLAAEVVLATRMNGLKSPAWGVKGGGAGRAGRFIVNPGSPDERSVPGFAEDVHLRHGDLLRIISNGGGGHGDPLDREAMQVREDVLDGFVSLEAARADYGVILDPKTLDLDEAATTGERERRRSGRSGPLPLFSRGAGYEELERARAAT
ncbi:MAG: hydantoinase B/oxoprolinase family protein [Chloroflexi bacterium]|nr:hydantoinase B/oxoprolinase family protein [Chloroflexota bacterium]